MKKAFLFSKEIKKDKLYISIKNRAMTRKPQELYISFDATKLKEWL